MEEFVEAALEPEFFQREPLDTDRRDRYDYVHLG